MRKTRVLAGAAGVLVVAVAVAAALVAGRRPDPWTRWEDQVQTAKKFIGGLRTTFEGGKLTAPGETPGAGDARMALAIGIMDKLQFNIGKYQSGDPRKTAALARIDDFIKAFDQVGRKYQQTLDTRNTHVARDLAADMRMLEGRLDDLTAALRGKAG
jgi:hypothetical protein